MSASLLHTVEQILNLSGALVEHAGEDALEVIAPSDVAAILGISEHTTLCINPATSHNGTSVLSLTPELHEQLSALLNHRGYFTQCIVKDLYVRRSGMGAAVEESFTILNGIGRVLDYHEEFVPYLLCNFKYTVFSDERKEGVVTVALNEYTALSTTELAMALSAQLTAAQPGNIPTRQKPLAKTYRVACRSASELIEHELVSFQRSLARRLQRDIERLHEYYGSLIAEIEKKIQRRKLEGEEKENEEKRIEATRLELQSKLLDQQERYAMDIKAELISAARIYIPAAVVRYQVQRRQVTRELTIIWNALRKDFDDVTCDGCGKGLRSFSLCDDRLHIACDECFRCPGCGRVACRGCHPVRCPKCNTQRHAKRS